MSSNVKKVADAFSVVGTLTSRPYTNHSVEFKRSFTYEERLAALETAGSASSAGAHSTRSGHLGSRARAAPL